MKLWTKAGPAKNSQFVRLQSLLIRGPGGGSPALESTPAAHVAQDFINFLTGAASACSATDFGSAGVCMSCLRRQFGFLAFSPTSGRGSATKPSRFGIFTLGRLFESITSASPMMPLRFRM